MTSRSAMEGVTVWQPQLPSYLSARERICWLDALVQQAIRAGGVHPDIIWYSTPMALPWSASLNTRVRVYDCLEDHPVPAGAPASRDVCERALLSRAQVVFAGAQRQCERKSPRHPNCHVFPSSSDSAHPSASRLERADASLDSVSWDQTWASMMQIINQSAVGVA